MPVLKLTEDERTILVTALTHESVRLMTEWKKSADDYESSPYWRAMDCAEIDEDVDAVTDLRRKIEAVEYEPKAAWHNEFGWLHPKKAAEAATAAVEAGELTREDVAAPLGVDLAEVDAENARDRGRQDQMSPGTWTTLPEGFDPDDWPFDTDPEPTTARIDVQTKGGKVRIDLAVGGRTTLIEAEPEAAARLLCDLNLAQRSY